MRKLLLVVLVSACSKPPGDWAKTREAHCEAVAHLRTEVESQLESDDLKSAGLVDDYGLDELLARRDFAGPCRAGKVAEPAAAVDAVKRATVGKLDAATTTCKAAL